MRSINQFINESLEINEGIGFLQALAGKKKPEDMLLKVKKHVDSVNNFLRTFKYEDEDKKTSPYIFFDYYVNGESWGTLSAKGEKYLRDMIVDDYVEKINKNKGSFVLFKGNIDKCEAKFVPLSKEYKDIIDKDTAKIFLIKFCKNIYSNIESMISECKVSSNTKNKVLTFFRQIYDKMDISELNVEKMQKQLLK